MPARVPGTDELREIKAVGLRECLRMSLLVSRRTGESYARNGAFAKAGSETKTGNLSRWDAPPWPAEISVSSPPLLWSIGQKCAGIAAPCWAHRLPAS